MAAWARLAKRLPELARPIATNLFQDAGQATRSFAAIAMSVENRTDEAGDSLVNDGRELGPAPASRGRSTDIILQADARGRDGWMTIEVPDELSRDGFLRIPRAPFEQWAVSRTADGGKLALPWNPVSQSGDPGVHDPYLADWLIGAGFAPSDIQPGDQDPVMDAFRRCVLEARDAVEAEVLARPARNSSKTLQARPRLESVVPSHGRPSHLSRPTMPSPVVLAEDAGFRRQAEMSDFLGHSFRLPSQTITIHAQVMHLHEDAADGFLIIRAEPLGQGGTTRSFYGPLRVWANDDVRAAAWSILDEMEPPETV